MKTIALTKGYVTRVDDQDYEKVMQLSWNAHIVKRKDGSIVKVYAAGRNKGREAYLLHRFLLDITDPKIEVDHEDHDGLNNQRHNLRTCTTQQNRQNKSKHGTSGFKGVSKSTKGWRARIFVGEKELLLGCFSNPLNAAVAYDMAAVKYFGEFANTNFARP